MIRFLSRFSLKLRSRWGEHFGSKLCERGLACCKRLNLPYNGKATDVQGAETVDLLSASDPWIETGPLYKCPLSIRHFASKTLTREYARKFNVNVPRTYGVLKTLDDFDSFHFPSRYVLKPDFASGVSLLLMHGNLNLFDGFTYTKDDIRAEVAKFMGERDISEFVVEEFVRQEGVEEDSPIIPLDYKIHCFGGKGRIIQVDDKNAIYRDALHRRQSWLSRDWTQARAPFRHVVEHPNDPIHAPKCLHKMLDVADAISSHHR